MSGQEVFNCSPVAIVTPGSIFSVGSASTSCSVAVRRGFPEPRGLGYRDNGAAGFRRFDNGEVAMIEVRRIGGGRPSRFLSGRS